MRPRWQAHLCPYKCNAMPLDRGIFSILCAGWRCAGLLSGASGRHIVRQTFLAGYSLSCQQCSVNRITCHHVLRIARRYPAATYNSSWCQLKPPLRAGMAL